MPREVDSAQRLADIAAATVRVARASGPHAVTIRAVARELGGSTTLVTNYLPSRAALILNALDRGSDRWQGELDRMLAAAGPAEGFAAVVEWAMHSGTDDPVLRALILEIIQNADREPDLRAALQSETERFEALLEEHAAAAGYADPAHVAGLAYLLVRGSYLATAEDPQRWSDAHLREVIRATLDTQPRR
ncbi:TetR family transcriptional regulator C-terminal domain-containing protein [Microbacterium fluvii]|uniref:TetR family transcriptional regulator C-terminal domain-containing protein n=1 Tax=Microbacterium fluvii TaxID=415215 RepID=A0ABW2HF64_9MICO|nr:TetR family transcriptional regulator C-terminal domain-containing protein [Microbacterium fluvii]MCU4673162.1 TetR family transcriptional regulator C-terminal domain-containing protein [Microbacterium fluvii]